ncbi:MAG: hypothetical protein CMO55_07465 [Verrucomicrobiales bacterium]|nr:hypothetical protein [Verrucomicrobiales bacterium]
MTMNNRESRSERGWTFVEMLVAIAISAVFLGAATLVMASISVNSKRLTSVVEVDIGSSTKLNFYGQAGNTLRVNSSPNYGKAARFEEFRDLILDDAYRSFGVYCLPRQLNNSIRPEFLRFEAGDAGSTSPLPRLDTPEAFRSFLADVEPTSAGIYDTAIRNVPDQDRPNTSIYMLSNASEEGYVRVHAIYEIDLVPSSSPYGTYASVRRYKNGSLTHYYDVFYPSGSGDAFHPVFVAFERSSRLAVNEGTAIDRFKVSDGNPFYLLWLPDPAINPYQLANWTASDPASSPRAAYEQMSGKTSMVIAIPMFPNL